MKNITDENAPMKKMVVFAVIAIMTGFGIELAHQSQLYISHHKPEQNPKREYPNRIFLK